MAGRMTIFVDSHRPLRGVLQAGGRGARLAPYTDTIPKPMVAVGGMPMIERLARQFALAGVRRIEIITGWLGEEIENHFAHLHDLSETIEFSFHREGKPLGNFGGMAGLDLFGETILFSFADLVTELDFAKLLEIHNRNGAQVTLASHFEHYRVSLGEIVTEGSRVLAYNEKPMKSFRICSGMAAINGEVLSVMRRGQPCGISDFVTAAIAAGYDVEHWEHGSVLVDVNTPERLGTAMSQLPQDTRTA
jgi:NDP-sugar pyrophosphorylase family protein